MTAAKSGAAEKSGGTAKTREKSGAARPKSAGTKMAVAQQVAALPWRKTDQLEIMLVSSRETRRWIIPKGWPMAGRSRSAAAAIEALEEAGLLGVIDETPFGRFTYPKKARGKAALCEVEVFPLRVARQRARWPEKDQRETRWFPARETAQIASDPGLGELIERFVAAREA